MDNRTETRNKDALYFFQMRHGYRSGRIFQFTKLEAAVRWHEWNEQRERPNEPVIARKEHAGDP